ncbi:MAG: SH3 domain-containing protein [Caldilineaceae bacterium]
MRTKITLLNPISPLICLTVVLTFTVLPVVLWPTTVLAQTTSSTPPPLPPSNELVVVAGGYGVDLIDVDGTVVYQAEPGARLVAKERTADNQWLLVTSADGTSGWALREQLLVFDRIALPTQDISISLPPTPTPEPIAVPTTIPANTDAQPAATDASESVMADEADIGAQDEEHMAQSDDMLTAATTGMVQTGSARLNVRSGPGGSYSIVAKAADGDSVDILARSADERWLQIAQPAIAGGFGWVAAQYIDLALPMADLPVSAASNEAVASSAMPNRPSNSAATPPGAEIARCGPAGWAARKVGLSGSQWWHNLSVQSGYWATDIVDRWYGSLVESGWHPSCLYAWRG